jgi:hypothetical protein
MYEWWGLPGLNKQYKRNKPPFPDASPVLLLVMETQHHKKAHLFVELERIEASALVTGE